MLAKVASDDWPWSPRNINALRAVGDLVARVHGIQVAEPIRWAELEIELMRIDQERKAVQPAASQPQAEMVNHPQHYNSLPAVCLQCGHPVECIDVIEVMPFNTGTAMKYLWRADHKGNPIEDLRKAAWYIQREIERRERREKRSS